jgi:threonine dehydratase
VQIDDVRAAAGRLRDVARRTPLLYDDEHALAPGVEVFAKCENLQRTGSFKVRGLYNRVATWDASRWARGIITLSAGNSAAAAALVARMHGVPCVVVMPADAVERKVDATRALGAEIVLVERREDLTVRLEELIAARSLAYAPSYDDPAVIAGQGTVALELLDEVPNLDALIVPTGGGGLLAGCAVVLGALRPGVRLIAGEPLGAAKLGPSLAAGRLVRCSYVSTIADGLATSEYGSLNFDLVRPAVDQVVAVSEPEILAAMARCWHSLRLAIEPSAAVALAALARLGDELEGCRVGVVLTGGNVEASLLLRALRYAPSHTTPR